MERMRVPNLFDKAVQRPTLSVLFFSLIDGFSIFVQNMLEKVKMRRTHQFSAFSLLPKEPS